MCTDDLEKIVEYRLAFTPPGRRQTRRHMSAVARVTTTKPFLENSDRFSMTQELTRLLRFAPHEGEPTPGRAETPTQDVVKGVEVVPPLGTWNQDTADLCVEVIEIMNSRAIELEFMNSHAHDPHHSCRSNAGHHPRTGRRA